VAACTGSRSHMSAGRWGGVCVGGGEGTGGRRQVSWRSTHDRVCVMQRGVA
jgi:hypothetical protein